MGGAERFSNRFEQQNAGEHESCSGMLVLRSWLGFSLFSSMGLDWLGGGKGGWILQHSPVLSPFLTVSPPKGRKFPFFPLSAFSCPIGVSSESNPPPYCSPSTKSAFALAAACNSLLATTCDHHRSYGTAPTQHSNLNTAHLHPATCPVLFLLLPVHPHNLNNTTKFSSPFSLPPPPTCYPIIITIIITTHTVKPFITSLC